MCHGKRAGSCRTCGVYSRVVAFDQSPQQLAHAPPHPHIMYKIGKVEALAVDSQTADLVAVAQALHWFSLNAFYAEVKRVLKPAGIFAVWTYNLHHITPKLDAAIREFHDSVLDGYWPPERAHITDGYSSLPFPFREIMPPLIEMQTEWTLKQLLGYLRSWSATQRYIDQNRNDPIALVADRLRSAWGDAHTRRVSWPLTLRIGTHAET